MGRRQSHGQLVIFAAVKVSRSSRDSWEKGMRTATHLGVLILETSQTWSRRKKG
jgi:hypothetical protein